MSKLEIQSRAGRIFGQLFHLLSLAQEEGRGLASTIIRKEDGTYELHLVVGRPGQVINGLLALPKTEPVPESEQKPYVWTYEEPRPR